MTYVGSFGIETCPHSTNGVVLDGGGRGNRGYESSGSIPRKMESRQRLQRCPLQFAEFGSR